MVLEFKQSIIDCVHQEKGHRAKLLKRSFGHWSQCQSAFECCVFAYWHIKTSHSCLILPKIDTIHTDVHPVLLLPPHGSEAEQR